MAEPDVKRKSGRLPVADQSEENDAPAETKTSLRKNSMRIEPLHTAGMEPDKPKPQPADTASFDTDDSIEDPKTGTQDLEQHKAAERAAQLEKIIEARTYFLPINQVQRRRTKQLVWGSLIVVLLLGAAWFYLLIDAGIINIPGFSPPTDLLG